MLSSSAVLILMSRTNLIFVRFLKDTLEDVSGITRSNEKDASLHPFPDNWWCTGVPLEDGRRFRIQDDTYMFWEVF